MIFLKAKWGNQGGESQRGTDPTAVCQGGDLIKVYQIEHAWLPVCLQEYCPVNSTRDWCCDQGGSRGTLVLEVGLQGESQSAGECGAFSLVERRVVDG